MFNNGFPSSSPLPNYDDGNGCSSPPPPPDYWTHYYQRQRHSHQRQRHSNQRYHHHQHFGHMKNNRYQNHPKQSKSASRDPNYILPQYEYVGWGGNYPSSQRRPLMQQLPSTVLLESPVLGDVGGFSKTVAITKPLTEGSKRNYRTKAKAFIIEFLQAASLHGFIYLSKVGLHFVERILWLVFICIAFFGVISLSQRTWERFQTSPMVMSMDRNKLVWNTSFPSLTVCPHKRIDDNKVDEYVENNKENFPNPEDKEDFRVFIDKLASLSYDNIESLPMNKTFGIASDKYLDTLFELKWNFEPELSSGTTVKMNIYQTITELGICQSVNTLVGQYSSYEYWTSNDWRLLDHNDRVTVHPLDGEIYAQIINLSTGYDVYFHSAGDIPNISKQKYTFPESDYTTVELIALETFTTPRAKELKINQRKCRFSNEADEMMTVPIYSYGLCLTECRMKLAWKACRCVPHFYRRRVLGCIDGSHVMILRPTEIENMFFNRKGRHSLNAMFICDENAKIMAVNARYGGSAHDSFVFNQSHERQALQQNYLTDERSAWLLGDSGYPLEPFLMTPYRNATEHSREMHFNFVHSQARSIVERSIGRLKTRWRIIMEERKCRYSPLRVVEIINACSALHNICCVRNVPHPEPEQQLASNVNDNNQAREFLDNSPPGLVAKRIRDMIRDDLYAI